MSVSIVLADDHRVVRSALRLLLDGESDLEVAAEAGDIESTVRYVRGHQPDVLILDLNMPGGIALEAVPEIKEISPATEIVVLTMHTDPAYAREALRLGVLGYVSKEAVEDELVTAVRHAARGEPFLQAEVAARLASTPEAGDPALLSERELEVLRLVALGHTNAEIAAELAISVRTIESHRSSVQHKLGAGKRSELVRAALERGLLDSRPG